MARLDQGDEWEKGRAAGDTSAAAPKLTVCRGEYRDKRQDMTREKKMYVWLDLNTRQDQQTNLNFPSILFSIIQSFILLYSILRYYTLHLYLFHLQSPMYHWAIEWLTLVYDSTSNFSLKKPLVLYLLCDLLATHVYSMTQ